MSLRAAVHAARGGRGAVESGATTGAGNGAGAVNMGGLEGKSRLGVDESLGCEAGRSLSRARDIDDGLPHRVLAASYRGTSS